MSKLILAISFLFVSMSASANQCANEEPLLGAVKNNIGGDVTLETTKEVFQLLGVSGREIVEIEHVLNLPAGTVVTIVRELPLPYANGPAYEIAATVKKGFFGRQTVTGFFVFPCMQ